MNHFLLVDSEITLDTDNETTAQVPRLSVDVPETDSGTLVGWTKVITRLLEWRADPLQLLDEDYLPPTREIIDLAIAVAGRAAASNLIPPLHVVPDGDGGVAFERKEGAFFQMILVTSNGDIEILSFQESKLICKEVKRSNLSAPTSSHEKFLSEAAQIRAPHREDPSLSDSELEKAA